jgi:hypothetical protein
VGSEDAASVVVRTAEAMEHYIVETGSVSLVELERVAAEHLAEISGDVAWVSPDDNKVVLWAGMSQEFSDALGELCKRGNVEPQGTNYLVYLVDGKMLSYPIAKRPPKSGYKEEHWVPVVFNAKEKG